MMQAKLFFGRSRQSLVADLVLAGLVSGPVAAPFLAASGLPVLGEISQIIYWMGNHVCPQPEMGLMLAPPWLMAVCMRCYGTVLGLVFTRVLYTMDQGVGAYWLGQYKLGGFFVSVIMMLFYPAELWLQTQGAWSYSNPVVFPFGWVAGLGLGLLVMPWLHGSSSKRLTTRRTTFGQP
jgi:uncharacterized membrane protein